MYHLAVVVVNERSSFGPLLTVLIVVTTAVFPCIEYTKEFRVSLVLLKSRIRHVLITNLGYMQIRRVQMKDILHRRTLQQCPHR